MDFISAHGYLPCLLVEVLNKALSATDKWSEDHLFDCSSNTAELHLDPYRTDDLHENHQSSHKQSRRYQNHAMHLLDKVILWNMACIRDPGCYICWFFINGLFHRVLAVSLLKHLVQRLSGQLVNLTGMAVGNMFVDWWWLFEWLFTTLPKSWWGVFTGWRNFLGSHKCCKRLNTMGKSIKHYNHHNINKYDLKWSLYSPFSLHKSTVSLLLKSQVCLLYGPLEQDSQHPNQQAHLPL